MPERINEPKKGKHSAGRVKATRDFGGPKTEHAAPEPLDSMDTVAKAIETHMRVETAEHARKRISAARAKLKDMEALAKKGSQRANSPSFEKRFAALEEEIRSLEGAKDKEHIDETVNETHTDAPAPENLPGASADELYSAGTGRHTIANIEWAPGTHKEWQTHMKQKFVEANLLPQDAPPDDAEQPHEKLRFTPPDDVLEPVPPQVPEPILASEPVLTPEPVPAPAPEAVSQEWKDEIAERHEEHTRHAATGTHTPEKQLTPFEAQKARIRELMLGNRGANAVADYDNMLEKVGSGIGTSKEFYEQSAVHTERMLKAEQAYLSWRKADQQSRGDIGVAAEQLFGERKLRPEGQALRNEWLKNRKEYAQYLKASALTRFDDRRHGNPEQGGPIAGLENYGGKKTLNREKVLERYNRLVIARQVSLGAEEAEQRAKEQGLAQREKGWLGKLYDKYKSKAKIIRVLATSALVTGGVILTGGSALALVLGATAITGAAVSLAAKRGSKLEKAGRFLSFAGIFGWLGGKTVEGAHDIIGSKENAAAKLKQRAGVDYTSASELEKHSKKRGKAVVIDETIDRHARYGRAAGAVAGGALAGHALHGFGGGGATGSWQDGPHAAGADPGLPIGPESHDFEVHVGDPLAHGHIDDADKLFGAIGKHLHEQYGSLDKMPPAELAVMKALHANPDGSFSLMHGEDPASTHFNFEGAHDGHGHTMSALVHNGDTARFHEGAFEFHRVGEPAGTWHTIIDKTGHGNDISQPLRNYADPVHHIAVHEASAPAIHETQPVTHPSDASSTAKADELMRHQPAMQSAAPAHPSTESSPAIGKAPEAHSVSEILDQAA